MKSLLTLLFPLLLLGAAIGIKTDQSQEFQVTAIPDEVREKFDLKPHYQKILLLDTFPIVASDKVQDAALHEAATVIQSMLKNRPDIIRELAKNNIRYSIMSPDERTCDIPEHSDLTPKEYWNRRARGLGATRERPSVSCGEENLLHNPGDPYKTESICVHEFAHAIHLMAVNSLDPTFDQRLKKTYESAMARGLWAGKYAGSNKQEYWAEAVQSWFGTNREDDHDHNHVNTRAELVDYDPAIAKLCQEVFGDNDWRYIRADHPSRKNEPHLKNLDRTKLAPFGWTEKEQADYESVSK
ncbi:hypothetical protein V2O64_19765 [Verrucomicrobiaceae bacterium 227]